MKNIYYAWWADSIIRIQHFNPKMKDWKMRVFQLNTLLNSLNLWVILVWLKYLNIYAIPILKIDIFPGYVLDSVLAYIIEFGGPFILLNYFLIFYKNKYQKIILKYQDRKLNLALPYGIIISVLSVITVIVYAIFWN